MIYKYLKNAVKRALDAYIPKHPNPQRYWELPDGSIVVADSYDDVELDKEGNFRPAPSITDTIKAGNETKLGGLVNPTIFTAAEFSQKFLRQFAIAGESDRAAAAAKAAAAAAAAPSVEPSNNE